MEDHGTLIRRMRIHQVFGLSALGLSLAVLLWFQQGCSSSYRDISTPSGRRALIEQTNNFLTSGLCQEAINTILPLYESTHRDNEIRLTYASALACKGGLNFAGLITSLQSVSGSDVWTPIILANYSAAEADGKVTALMLAAGVLRETAADRNDQSGRTRPEDANVYMIFVQAEIIATTISQTTMGNADSATGKKRQTLIGTGNSTQKCRIQVAVSTIYDTLRYVSTGSGLDTLSTSIGGVCGANCDSNLDPNVCTFDTATLGGGFLTAIDGQWSL